ncbi:hypothetical protein [Methyloferula stellata]|uniref:hypothetical protein n=1 Tax=Methyloferula stellata TaxID=876270 RepID=UPI0003634323|nr:hypothetical protein [Methyloferula stellata]
MLAIDEERARYAHIDLRPLDGMSVRDAWLWILDLKDPDHQAYALVEYVIYLDSDDLFNLGRSLVNRCQSRPDRGAFAPPALADLQKCYAEHDSSVLHLALTGRVTKRKNRAYVQRPGWYYFSGIEASLNGQKTGAKQDPSSPTP